MPVDRRCLSFDVPSFDTVDFDFVFPISAVDCRLYAQKRELIDVSSQSKHRDQLPSAPIQTVGMPVIVLLLHISRPIFHQMCTRKHHKMCNSPNLQ